MNLIFALIFVTCVLCEVQSSILTSQRLHKKNLKKKRVDKQAIEVPAVQQNARKINVHLFPHSHQDIGWQATLEEYYDFSGNAVGGVLISGVGKIISDVISDLENNPARTFLFSDLGFFSRWWFEQKESKKELVKKLSANGQIEFVGGGWSMNDEACAYYEDIIENLEIGHQFLKDELGVKPQVAWQLDTFGHTATQAAIFARSGYNAVFVNRIHYKDLENRMKTGRLELEWSPEGYNDSIFATITYKHYYPPKGICFDWCRISSEDINRQSFVDDTVNNHQAVENIVNYLKNITNAYPHPEEIYHLFGDDFAFGASSTTYENIDLLLKKINSNESYGLNVFYSTPSKYLAKIKDMNKSSDRKTDDFLPYADNNDAYWTGFYTSRPATKVNIKNFGRYFQVVRTIHGLLSLRDNSQEVQKILTALTEKLKRAQEALAINQHHDAVTGTSTQYVTDDFQSKIANAKLDTDMDLTNLISKLTAEMINEDIIFEYCEWNETIATCDISKDANATGETIVLAVLNPWLREKLTVKVLTRSPRTQIIDEHGNTIDSDVICSSDNIFHQKTQCQVYFQAELREYGLTFFRMLLHEKKPRIKEFKLHNFNLPKKIKLVGERYLKIKHNKEFEFIDHKNGVHRFALDYKYYYSVQGKEQNSGSYIFRESFDEGNQNASLRNRTKKVNMFRPKSIKVFSGSVTTQILLESHNVSCLIKFFKDKHLEAGFELETKLNSINTDDSKGKEVILEVRSTSIQNDGVFYTDSNGLRLIKRKLNENAFGAAESNLPSSNYFPVNSLITIEGREGERMSVLNDRSEGGSSLKSGLIELMIHRRMLDSDGRGLTETLDEYDDSEENIGLRQIFVHRVLFGESEADDRLVQIRNDYAPIIFQGLSNNFTFSKVPTEQNSKFNNIFNIENKLLKVSIKHLTEREYLMRVQNLDPTQSHELVLPENVLEEVFLAPHPKEKINFNGTRQPNSVLLQPFEIRAFKIKSPKTLVGVSE